MDDCGSGIIHQEMPKGDERGLLWGFPAVGQSAGIAKMMEDRGTAT